MSKYNYIYVLKGNYGQGYEDLTAECSRELIRARLKEYRENDSYSKGFKIFKRRELATEE